MPRKYRHRRASKNADVERTARSKSVGKKKDPRFTARVDIFVHHFRSRLADPDNLCIKYCLDEIVARSLLRDDTSKEVRYIFHDQEKVQNAEDEKTIIEIRLVDDGSRH